MRFVRERLGDDASSVVKDFSPCKVSRVLEARLPTQSAFLSSIEKLWDSCEFLPFIGGYSTSSRLFLKNYGITVMFF